MSTKIDNYLKQFVEYIKNTGGNPTIDMFVEDWQPIGYQILHKLIRNNIITISKDYIITLNETSY